MEYDQKALLTSSLIKEVYDPQTYIVKGKLYNLEEDNFVTNSLDYAQMVEKGWNDNPEYGWKAKGGYHVVGNNIGAAEAILEAVAQKVSKL